MRSRTVLLLTVAIAAILIAAAIERASVESPTGDRDARSSGTPQKDREVEGVEA